MRGTSEILGLPRCPEESRRDNLLLQAMLDKSRKGKNGNDLKVLEKGRAQGEAKLANSPSWSLSYLKEA